jgi:hypothetical protein
VFSLHSPVPLGRGPRRPVHQATSFSHLRCRTSASQEMRKEQDDAHHERNVDETRGYVKREKPEEPQNDQNCSEYP